MADSDAMAAAAAAAAAGLTTAAEAASERGVSPSRMRDLIAAAGVAAVARQPGRTGANLYPAEHLAAIPVAAQGARSDLLAHRIGRLVAAAKLVADARGAEAEHGKLYADLLAGNPRAVARLAAAVRRWTKRRPAPSDGVAAAAAEVVALAAQIGDLPAVLPMALRSRIMTGSVDRL